MNSKRIALASLAALATLVPISSPKVAGADSLDIGLAKVLEGQVDTWRIVKLDVASTLTQLEAGKVELPRALPGGKTENVTWPARPAHLRDESLKVGHLVTPDGVEEVLLPPEQAYRVGECTAKQPSCAAVTVIDSERGWLHAMMFDANHGTSFLESVDGLLGTARYPGMHVVYNGADARDVVPDDDTRLSDCGPDDDDCDRTIPELDLGDAPPFTSRQTQIVLDGDASFFAIDMATWAQRQLATFNDMHLMYSVIEPLSVEVPETARWQLQLTVKHQRVWTSAGGPSSANSTALTREISSTAYRRRVGVTSQEIHLFFVGFDVANVFGQAAGIGNVVGGLGGGKSSAFLEARSGQTAKTKWVVATHEVGHLLGGHHGLGAANSCTFFLGFVQICGTSIMAPGRPNDRQPYFTDANDASIALVLHHRL